jgi:hypothetical protein
MLPLTQLDITGLDALADLKAELLARGVLLVAAGRRSAIEHSALQLQEQGLHFPTLRKALQAYRKTFLPIEIADDQLNVATSASAGS